MSYPAGIDCGTSIPQGSNAFYINAGPGVVSATGLPAGLSVGTIYPGYLTGQSSDPAGYYPGTVNGENVTWIVLGTNPGPIGWTPEGIIYLTVGVPCTAAFTALYNPGLVPGPGEFAHFHPLVPFCAYSDNMPPGITLQGDGRLTGTPTLAGTYDSSLVVAASGNALVGPSGSFRIVVDAGGGALALVCGGPPGGTVGVAYSHSFPASGGAVPYAFSILSGALPDGLSLGPATGQLTGTPTTAATFSFRVGVTDSAAATAHADCSIVIGAASPIVLACGGPPAGTVGVPYSHSFPASGGAMPYAWGLVTGLLPSGLTLAATGTVAGVPSVAGTFAFTVVLTDSYGATATVGCSITIAAAAAIPGGPGAAPLRLSAQNAAPVILPDPTKDCK